MKKHLLQSEREFVYFSRVTAYEVWTELKEGSRRVEKVVEAEGMYRKVLEVMRRYGS